MKNSALWVGYGPWSMGLINSQEFNHPLSCSLLDNLISEIPSTSQQQLIDKVLDSVWSVPRVQAHQVRKR